MPSSMTHAYFSKDVLDKLNRNIKKNLDLEQLKVFSQGPDIYYFYNFLIGKKAKNSFEIGCKLHNTKINDYFINMINYINNNNLYNNKQIKSFLFGSIFHFVLDSTVHPLVVYKTGIFNKKDKNSFKYNSLHQEMEYYIDIYMIFQNEKIEAKKYKVYKSLFTFNKISKNLTELINSVMDDTYNLKNCAKIYSKCLKDIKLFFKYFNYDPTGIKKIIYQLIDLITPKKITKVKELSFHVKHNKKIHYLNLEKKTWNHPCYFDETYNYSFIELYIIAINKAINIVETVDKMLTAKKIDEQKLQVLFNDTSYLTGKNYHYNKDIKFFEF